MIPSLWSTSLKVPQKKKVFSLAGLICDVCQKYGVMDMNVQTYNLEPKLTEAGSQSVSTKKR